MRGKRNKDSWLFAKALNSFAGGAGTSLAALALCSASSLTKTI